MSQIFNEKAKFDPANRAENILDHVLDETSELTQQQKANEVSVDEALHTQQVVQRQSTRIQSRILLITRDQSAYDENSELQTYFNHLSNVFDEVHVMVMQVGKRNTQTIRVAHNVWVYPVVAKYFLSQTFVAFSVVKHQLQFAEGFRPDIVISLDPFESGIAGYLIAKKYKRAFQVHVTEDYFLPAFETKDKQNKWRLRFARYVLRRTQSIRTNTSILQEKLQTKYPKKKNIHLLPRFFNITNIIKRAKQEEMEDVFPQFSFTILYIGSLTHNSTLFRAIDATRRLLATPSIGFVVIGDGPAKTEFQERTKILGTDKQTLFLSKVDDIVQYMCCADVLLCTDTTSESDEVVIQSAAAGLPMVIACTQLRDDLFTDNEDAFLCDPEDTIDFSTKLMKFLNTNALRKQFAQNAQYVVETRIEESVESYQEALRASIEEALVYMDEEPRSRKEDAVSASSAHNTTEEAITKEEESPT